MMVRFNKGVNYFVLPIILSLLLLGVSLSPLPKFPDVEFIATDKLLHLLSFMVLALSYLWAFSKYRDKNSPLKLGIVLTLLICSVIGASIELLQYSLPINRFGDWYDFYFDIAGIVLAILLFLFMRRSKLIFSLFLVLLSLQVYSQEVQNSKEFQDQLNTEFGDPEESPLDSIDLVAFQGLEFFPINEKYRVEAKLVKQNSPTFFGMETTTDRRPEYRIWAYAYFSIDGKEYQLTIYQNKKLMNTLEYGDYLFLPFTDATNGKSSYHGGRYVDLRIPEGESIIIDFNKSYNPYCAYSKKYSCPIVPKENGLDLNIEAGVKKFH